MLIDVSIWDKESMKEDDFVGRGSIKVEDIMGQQSKKFVLPLTYEWEGKERTAGSLNIEASVFA